MLDALVDAALPQACALCAARSGREWLCAACREALPAWRDACPTCARPSPGARVCGACVRSPPPFDGAVAALAYAFPVDRLVQRLKYGGDLAAAPALAAALAEAVRRPPPRPLPDAIVPVPLGRARQRQRGFNQAIEIARPLGLALRIPLRLALARVTETAPQADLRWSARARNVRGAFRADADVRGARLALVDDVMTTGATLAAAARALRRAGAARVDVWVVARTPPPGEQEPR